MWYFNDLLVYLMSFTSLPVIVNDKDKPGCVFFSYIEMFLYVETATDRVQNDSIIKSYDFNNIVCW